MNMPFIVSKELSPGSVSLKAEDTFLPHCGGLERCEKWHRGLHVQWLAQS